jgi:hypothetical protein
MDSVLLDTDVFSYLMKPKDARGDAYRPHVKGKTVAVSFITVGELYYGAEKRKWSGKTLRNLKGASRRSQSSHTTWNSAAPMARFAHPYQPGWRSTKRSVDRYLRYPPFHSTHHEQPETF